MAQSARRFKNVIAQNIDLEYLIYLPQGYDGSLTWPLILFLHGAGERGHNLDKVLTQGLPKRLQQGRDIPFIVVSPLCPPDSSWERHDGEVMRLLDEILATYPIKRDQIYLTGLSMGGCGTWFMAQKYPGRFAAIAPICGWMPWSVDFAGAVERIKKIPTWVFHGAKDELISVEESRKLVTALQQVNAPVKYTEYPDLTHDSWTVTYENQELYKWLLQQRQA